MYQITLTISQSTQNAFLSSSKGLAISNTFALIYLSRIYKLVYGEHPGRALNTKNDILIIMQ